jgi:hypothetical protein
MDLAGLKGSTPYGYTADSSPAARSPESPPRGKPMRPIPANDLRTNLATWAVAPELVPAVTSRMLEIMPRESFDPCFAGQQLETTYFDDAAFALRKARKEGKRYLTIRVRHYLPSDTYAFSAKTESGKFRIALPADEARNLIEGGCNAYMLKFLPADLLARLLDLTDDVERLRPVTTICFRRYAVENSHNRLTLDIKIETDTGKCFPCDVLEYKSTEPHSDPYEEFLTLGLRPVKLSKFLWATRT